MNIIDNYPFLWSLRNLNNFYFLYIYILFSDLFHPNFLYIIITMEFHRNNVSYDIKYIHKKCLGVLEYRICECTELRTCARLHKCVRFSFLRARNCACIDTIKANRCFRMHSILSRPIYDPLRSTNLSSNKKLSSDVLPPSRRL